MPELEKVSDPSWLADCETEGTYQDDFYISITSYEIVDGYNGQVLRVYLDFTNNSKEATSFLMLCQSYFYAALLLCQTDLR